MKRLWGLVAAVALLGGAAAATRVVEGNRDRSLRQETRRAAESAGTRASDGLLAHVAELKLKAQNAAANPRLSAALQANVDAATLQDLFRNEVWWEPYRNEFKVYAIAFDSDKLDILEGMRASEFAADRLVRQARDRREAVAEIVMGRGWPYAAAATVAPVPERAVAPVLVLAKPIDEAAVRQLADKARGAVLLSDGRSAIVESGDGAERALLRRAVGAEQKSPIYEAPDGAWGASVSQLAPGLWMWTYAAPASARDSEASARSTKIALWGVAALGAIVALFLGLRLAPGGKTGQTTGQMTGQTTGQIMTGETTGEAGETTGRTFPRAEAATLLAVPGRTGAGGGGAGRTPAITTASPIPAPAGGTTLGLGRPVTEVFQPIPGDPGSGATVTFGRYTLIDRLGAGGMAEVYTAVTFGAEGFRRTFVVKRLRAELARDPDVVAQFIDEANLGSNLVHSNIIPVFDFGKVGDEYFLAQEYILGRDLGRTTARMIERQSTALPYPVVLHVAHETLKALEYAHTKLAETGRPMGIVHRDVSPNNVLISARGEVKLFDFGIVKAEGRVTKTEQGVVKGNLSFMSPEQARGIEVDARADLFSMGLVMFYCLTGEVLYRGNTTYELLVRAATGPAVEELARIAALPGPCAEIVGKALKVEPAQRYQTAGEFAAALLPHITGAAAQVLHLMRDLFAEELQQEEARFASVAPSGDRSARAPGTNGPQAVTSRRS